MNQQRLQAYYQLIQSLLSCSSEEELAAILQGNQNLLDAGFLQTLQPAVEYYSQYGNENQANLLRNLADQLRVVLNSPKTTSDVDNYLQFLLEVLQATADSNRDGQLVYLLLAKNTDKLDDNFAKILRLWATNILAEAEPDKAESIAEVILNFSTLIQQFPLGNKASNMEIGITGNKIALTIFTQADFPQDWAMTQNNLGNCYSDRIKGDTAENLEMAIAAYNAALQIYTLSDFPQAWAMTQNNLGAAYWGRIRGDKSENLEAAIAAFSAALQVRTRSDFPQAWAMTQNNLGGVYSKRIRGDKAENLEAAIAAYSATLEIITLDQFPQDWAHTQNSLGAAYLGRIRGDKAENLEAAIAAFSAALQVHTRADFPQAWATTQNNLGNAYNDRIRGDKAENLEAAIAAFSAALQIYTPSNFPQAWAMTQVNLGNAYSERIGGDKAENLEAAIAAFSAALQIYTPSNFPLDWATTQNNLGTAYNDRIRGDKAENLEKAIAAYHAALKVRTRVDFPQDWAMTQANLGNAYIITAYINTIREDKAENLEQAITAFSAALQIYTPANFPLDWALVQNNLGTAYRERIRGNKTKNLEQAIAAYNATLEVITRSNFPQKYAETWSNIGILYQDAKEFESAYNGFVKAIETVEALRGEIISGEEAKRKQAEEWNQLYRCMVEVCLALGRNNEAIEYVERSKTRNLVELILNRDLKTIFPREVVTQLELLRDEIANGQYQLQNGKAENPTVLAQHLQQLRQQRQKLQDEYLPVGSGFKFEQFQKTLDERTAIIEWYIASDRILAFVIKPHGQELTFWQSQPEDLDALINWGNQYLYDYYNPEDQDKIQWHNQLEERLKKLAEILHIEEILDLVPKECDRLILIPHRFLHLFPLHALPVGKSYLLDLFSKGVGYAPSCQLLQQVQLRQRPDFQSLFAIQTPTQDLYEKDLGAVAAIRKQFSDTYILKQAKAKKSAIISLDKTLLKANCAFFFCHGYFNPNSPLDSGLQLADDNLTLADIITHLKLDNCRLVTLSACETGITDITSTSDEYIGLPSGFLLAGSTNVVSSLWAVSATATALLMIKFYEELQRQSNITLALNTAQNWLRNTPLQEFRTWLRNSNLDEDWQDELDEQFQQIEEKQGSKTKIFASPFYWSAFCAIGKGV